MKCPCVCHTSTALYGKRPRCICRKSEYHCACRTDGQRTVIDLFRGQPSDRLRRLRTAIVEDRVAPKGWRQFLVDPADYVWKHPEGVPAAEVVAAIDDVLAERQQNARTGRTA